MAKESKEKKLQRMKSVLRLLQRYYPDAHCALNHENADQLLVATILSAQCTDERVNIVTQSLFKKYPDLSAFAKADLGELEQAIRPTGFFRNKAKNIKACAQKITSEFEGKIPQDLETLNSMPGVGRKTANVVLGNAFGIASGIVVDTHVRRLSQRLDFTRHENPEIIERDLIELVSQKHWVMFSHWLITHGRQVCKARSPRCETCFLLELCPQRGV